MTVANDTGRTAVWIQCSKCLRLDLYKVSTYCSSYPQKTYKWVDMLSWFIIGIYHVIQVFDIFFKMTQLE